MPETAKRTARVPILGENGRISDDYIPAAIGENVTKAETAATRAESAATAAESAKTAAEKAKADAESAGTAAANSASSAATSASQAQQSATEAKASESSARASAESASSDAGSASSSATAARQSAAEAASSATDAKASADLAAGWVPSDGEPGQLLAKTDSGTAWADPPSGNVLVGTATGYVAHADDAYAAKPREVRIKGKTWVNLWPVINSTSSGITVSTDETGLITVSGTATADATITAEAAYAPSSAYVMASTYGSPSTWHIVNGETRVASGMELAVPSATCGVTVKSGTAVDASFRVMLVEGSEAPDCFTPPASITSVQAGDLVTAGKNLLSSSTFTDGYLSQGILNFSLPAGTYTLSCYNAEDWWTDNPNGGNWFIHRAAGNIPVAQVTMGSPPSVGSRSHATFTLSYSGDFVLYTYKTDIAEMATDLQLELGSTATAYEPPNVTTTPLPEVELRSLPDGTCDELVIGADGTCEVERKTVEITFDGSEDEAWAFSTGGYFETRQIPGVDLRGIGIVCDRYPSHTGVTGLPDKACAVSAGASVFAVKDSAYSDVSEFTGALQDNPITVIFFMEEQSTEPQSPVTLPQLPAPTFNIYHDSQVPSDTSVEYERDVNIAYAELEAKISALTVAQATS